MIVVFAEMADGAAVPVPPLPGRAAPPRAGQLSLGRGGHPAAGHAAAVCAHSARRGGRQGPVCNTFTTSTTISQLCTGRPKKNAILPFSQYFFQAIFDATLAVLKIYLEKGRIYGDVYI